MSQIPPIFLIKEKLDPFYLYGAESDFPEHEQDEKLRQALRKAKHIRQVEDCRQVQQQVEFCSKLRSYRVPCHALVLLSVPFSLSLKKALLG